MKLNNRGFTLVELLAVMVILITISLVAVGNISSSLTKREKKEEQEQTELAIGAAKIYFSLSETNVTCVSIQYLVDEGYIKDSKQVDKLGGGVIKLNSNDYIKADKC